MPPAGRGSHDLTVLPDTSVWVPYLRRGNDAPTRSLGDLLRADRVVVCGPVVAELLAGTAEGQREELWHLLAGLPWAEIGRAQWRQTGELAAALSERGEIVPLTDVEIAVAAVNAGAALWSMDTDFERVAGALGALTRYEP